MLNQAVWPFNLTLYSQPDSQKTEITVSFLTPTKFLVGSLHAWLRQALAKIQPSQGFSFRIPFLLHPSHFSDDVILSQLPWGATSRLQKWGLGMFNMSSKLFLPLLCSISYGISCWNLQGKEEVLSFTYRMYPILLNNWCEKVIRTTRTEDTCLWHLDILWTG